MRIPRWGVCLLGVGCRDFVGCSQTGWLRPNGPPDPKTTASVNGKPVTTAAGEAGSGSVPARGGRRPRPAAGGRLADLGAGLRRGWPGGAQREGAAGRRRVVRRPGQLRHDGPVGGVHAPRAAARADYTVIAEYQGEDGMMSGRVQARAPETGVRIALGARDPAYESEPRGSKVLPARVRSTLFPDDETDGFPATARPRVPAPAEDPTDREPPAEDATASRRGRRSSAAEAGVGRDIGDRPRRMDRPPAVVGRPDGPPRPAADADDPRNGPPAPGDRRRG